ncbi:hypothetical protein ACB092_04G069500 [Castanea dentata]
MKKVAVFVMVSFVLVSSLLTLSQGQQSVCSQQMVLEGTCDDINCGASFPSSAQPRNCSCQPASADLQSLCTCDVFTCGEDKPIEPTPLPFGVN